MITWLKLYPKLYPNTVGKYFPPRQRKVLPFAINVRYLLASINYRKVLLFAIPIVMYMVAFSSTLRKYPNLDLPKGMSPCWPLYIERIVRFPWTSNLMDPSCATSLLTSTTSSFPLHEKLLGHVWKCF